MPDSDSQELRTLEVAYRQHGPVEVTLLWNPGTSLATVVVWDWSDGTCLRMTVEPALARYAFDHPYAYAAATGVEQDAVQQAV